MSSFSRWKPTNQEAWRQMTGYLNAGYRGDLDALRLRLTRYAHAHAHNETPVTDATIKSDEVATGISAVFEFMHQIDFVHFNGRRENAGLSSESLLPVTPDEPKVTDSPSASPL